MAKVTVQDIDIRVTSFKDEDYLSLTDMLKAKDGEFFFSNWLRNRNTVEFLGVWEKVHNPDFNCAEFDIIKSQAGLNSYRLSAKEWMEKTHAIGIISKAGRYGGTFAHKDIAYNFGMWLNPAFYLLVVKEVQRLESAQNDPLLLQWDIKRILTKTNYTIHTDAIKNGILPTLDIEKTKEHIIYASEADLLNIVLFGCTAKDWQEANPELSQKMNIRDTATINELLVLSNLESYNSELIHQGKNRPERFSLLMDMRNKQLEVLQQANADFNFRKLSGNDPKLLK